MDNYFNHLIELNDTALQSLNNLSLNKSLYTIQEISNDLVYPDTNKKINKKELEITYSDNSKGIPNKIKKQMMKDDYQGMASNNGLGLGISLIKKIIKGVNGKLVIQNRIDEDYTKGTTFILILKRFVKD